MPMGVPPHARKGAPPTQPGPSNPPRHRSPWVGVDPTVDPLRWARVLRRAHELALHSGTMPRVVRSVIASSWRRAAESGVDPDAHPPTVWDDKQTTNALRRHPVAHLLPLIERLLREATEEARYFVALSDPDGVLLWIDGHSKALDAAASPRFLPGHLCSEAAVGTNAVGTAIALDHPVQIFAAEHFNRRLHGLTCSAAPIRDPETHRTIGVLDLTGSFHTAHPHSLSLVSAVARVVEECLAREQLRREDQLRAAYLDLVAEGEHERSAIATGSGRVLAASPAGWLGSRLRVRQDGGFVLPDGVAVSTERIGGPGGAFLIHAVRRSPPRAAPTIAIDPLGPRRARVSIGDWSTELSPRHSEIVMLLALHPEGLSRAQLGERIYGPGTSAVTVRAEVCRLRKLLGPVLAGNPYRLSARVSADREAIERVLAAA